MIKIEKNDLSFIPHNDMSADDIELVTQHKKLINQGNYSNAVDLLNNNNYHKGFRASLFNSIQNKIRALEIYLLNEYVAADDELYSLTEPTEAQMKGKIFWIQPF